MSSTPQNRVHAAAAIARHSRGYVDTFVDWFLGRGWPSYAFVALLQLKIIWDIWRFRDLTGGDTAAYFGFASQWVESFTVNIVWSPLYTAFYGTLLELTGDLYAATILHRVIIVFAATLGVLAIMRRTLPAGLALLVAVWWAILPINFETLYEVHLFALLPILAACLAASGDTARARGIALAILLAATVLVRNELIIATAVFGLTCLWRELTERRENSKTASSGWRWTAASYGLPILLAAVVCALAYWRSDPKFPALAYWIRDKHILNMCQVYAFGYQQRHPDWTLSPWLECQALMTTDFGQPLLGIGQMIVANFPATLRHFLWNLSLSQDGFQVALFNSMSGTVNPDYAPVSRSRVALVLTIVVFLVVAAAGAMIAGHRRYWVEWFRERKGMWLIFLAVASVAVPVIITQRPRPSYLFSTTVVLMAVVGTAVHILTARWPRLQNCCAVALAVAALLAVPSYYVDDQSGRPIYTNYRILQPFAAQMKDGKRKIVFGDHYGELTNYLGLGLLENVETFDYGILAAWKADQPLHQFLKERGIDVFYIQPRMMVELRSKSQARDLLDRPQSVGWRRLWPEQEVDPASLLLYRDRAGEPP